MKIVYATDLHYGLDKEWDFKYLDALRNYVEKNKPDLVVVSGDLIDSLFSEEEAQKNKNLLGYMLEITKAELERREARVSPYEFMNAIPIIAKEILNNNMYPSELKEIAEKYLKTLDKAVEKAKDIYILYKSMLPQAYFLPGNHDIDFDKTPLEERNLHGSVLEVKGFKVVGYGGAALPNGMPIPVENVPIELTTPFNEIITDDGVISEIYEAISKVKPDIIFSHVPPLRYLDEVEMDEKKIHVGSPGLAKLAEDFDVKLICCGHVHERRGIKKIRKDKGLTVVVNGGSLNKNLDGYFVEITLDEETKKFESASFIRVIGPEVIFEEEKYLRTNDDGITSLLINKLLD